MIFGILRILLGTFFFSLMYLLNKISSKELSPLEVIFYQAFFSLLFLIPKVLKDGTQTLNLKNFFFIFLRTIAGLSTAICIFLAFKELPLAEVLILNNTAPLFVPILFFIFEKKKISSSIFFSLLVGFFGVGVFVDLKEMSFSEGCVFALISAVSSAFIVFFSKKIAQESFLKIFFYYFVIVCLIVGSYLKWQLHIPTIQGAILFTFTAIVTLLGHYFFATSFRFAPAHVLGGFLYFSAAFGAIWDFLLWQRLPSIKTLLGIIIIAIGGVLTTVFTKVNKGEIKHQDLSLDKNV